MVKRKRGDVEGRKTRTVQTITSEVIDGESGEVKVAQTTEIGIKEKEPPFVKMYISDVSRLLNIDASSSNLLHLLVSNMGYNNVVAMYKPIKEMMCAELGIAMSTLNNAVDNLHKKGILLRKARGLYVVDPDQFGKGHWQDVKQIRLTVEYGEDGTKKINTELFHQLKIGF